ncbi:hypothetical protein [Candidatus Palauibacter sp.]|uniref:hypothetical protein n=1 Tax=Candidatus Palauibacter sp. TaxID=3101350 RepID=UPI003CC5E41F
MYTIGLHLLVEHQKNARSEAAEQAAVQEASYAADAKGSQFAQTILLISHPALALLLVGAVLFMAFGGHVEDKTAAHEVIRMASAACTWLFARLSTR